MKRLITSILLACLLVVAPSAQAATFSQPQIDSLLGLLNAFNVPSSAVSTVASILGSTASSLPFVPSLVGFAPTVTRIVHIGHHADRDPEPEEEVAETPDWVPEGALAFADFKNGHYWINGEGEVAVTDMFESDPLDNDVFDVERIVAGEGFTDDAEDSDVYYGAKVKTSSTLHAAVLAGSTVVVEINSPESEPIFNLFMYNEEAGYETYWAATLEEGAEVLSVSDSNETVTSSNETSIGLTRIAATFSEDVFEAALNGGDVVTIANPVVAEGHPLASLNFYMGRYSNDVVRSITIYPVQDASDLPVLSTPDWVPEDALVVADFKNGHYWVKDVGTVDVEDILETDDEDGDTFIPENIEADVGYVASGDETVGGGFMGAALPLILAGATWVLDFSVSDLDTEGLQVVPALYSGDAYENYWYASVRNLPSIEEVWTVLGDGFSEVHGPVAQVGQNRLAVTISQPDDRLSSSINGEGAITLASPIFDSEHPFARAVFSLIGTATSDTVLRSLVIYPPQDDADLPALSEL